MAITVRKDRPVFRVRALPEGKADHSIDLSDTVLSFQYVDEESKADKLNLKIDNWNLDQFDNPIWTKGTILEVTWGYPGAMSPIRRAIVQKIKGFRSLTIEAHGMAMCMHKVKRSRVWTNQTLAEIARAVAQSYGAEFGVPSGTTGENIKIDSALDRKVGHRVQASETDASFLTRLARRHGLQFYVDSTGLHFKTRNLQQTPVRSWTWFNGEGELIDLDIENDVTARAGAVTKKGLDPLSKKLINHKADNESTKRDGLAAVVEIVDPRTGAHTFQKRSAEEHTEHTTEPTGPGAKSHAEGKYRETQHRTVRLSFTAEGDADVLAKRVIEIKGIGRRLSGKYYINSVTHTIENNGYTMSGKARTDGHNALGAKSGAALNRKSPGEQTETIEKVDPRTGTHSIEYRKKGEEKH